MKSILLIGLGDLGQKIAVQLYDKNCEVMAVDIVEERVEDVMPYVTNGQIGDCTDKAFLKELGINNYDLIFNTIGGDFKSSLESTLTLKELGAKYIVARADDETHEKLLRYIGADSVLYPEKQMARWAAIRYGSDHVLDFISLDDEHAVYELEVPSNWIGLTIGKLDIRKKYNINIVALKNNGKFNPTINAETELTPGTTMLVMGETKQIQKYFHVLS